MKIPVFTGAHVSPNNNWTSPKPILATKKAYEVVGVRARHGYAEDLLLKGHLISHSWIPASYFKLNPDWVTSLSKLERALWGLE